jgi:hypothetical protein
MVTRSGRSAPIEANPAPTTDDTAQGWYLYGITRAGALAAALAELPCEGTTLEPSTEAAPLELLESSGLIAVVRQVLLSDFSPAVMQLRMRSAADLEAMVRSHNRVIETIHAEQPILPAKFGMVYRNAGDIIAGLRAAPDALLRQLARLEGCDEWAVHLHADRAIVRECISTNDPLILRLREEASAARPGRAWFLERQIRDELEAATTEALFTIAQQTYDRLGRSAVAGQVGLPAPGGDPAGEAEILRASFLVPRTGAERFVAEVRAGSAPAEGLRCECSGPWPAYSFAVLDGREAE